MQQLLSIARIDATQVKSILSNFEITEFHNLTGPCYLPRLQTYYTQLHHACAINENNIKDLAERTWRGRRNALANGERSYQLIFCLADVVFFESG